MIFKIGKNLRPLSSGAALNRRVSKFYARLWYVYIEFALYAESSLRFRVPWVNKRLNGSDGNLKWFNGEGEFG